MLLLTSTTLGCFFACFGCFLALLPLGGAGVERCLSASCLAITAAAAASLASLAATDALRAAFINWTSTAPVHYAHWVEYIAAGIEWDEHDETKTAEVRAAVTATGMKQEHRTHDVSQETRQAQRLAFDLTECCSLAVFEDNGTNKGQRAKNAPPVFASQLPSCLWSPASWLPPASPWTRITITITIAIKITMITKEIIIARIITNSNHDHNHNGHHNSPNNHDNETDSEKRSSQSSQTWTENIVIFNHNRSLLTAVVADGILSIKPVSAVYLLIDERTRGHLQEHKQLKQ